MIAPRKLQSLTPPTQAEAAAVSSVRLTFRVVTKKGFAAALAGRDFATDLPTELENAVCVNLRDALIKTASANNDKIPLLFIPVLLCS
jgi:hypothetical protein